MGKKRIKTIDLAAEEKKEKPEKGGQAIVKSGKQHGRIADMGTVMLEEMEKRRKAEAEKHLEGGVAPAAHLRGKIKKEKARKKPSKLRVRSRRYQALRKLIKPDKLYPLPEAIELLKKVSNAKFKETVELHLVVLETGKLTKDIKTEKKAPLVHLKIGKTSWPNKKLEEAIQGLLKAIDINKIKKAVLTSSMGPGIKIDISPHVS